MSTARSIAPPGRSCSPSAARSAAARPDRPKITRGYRLEAKHVIHAVGPVWSGGASGEDDLLACCYRSALALAAGHRLASIAFPAISTGVYQFPPDRAARIAVGTVAADIANAPRGISRVVFCCFSPDAAERHQKAFIELGLVLRLNDGSAPRPNSSATVLPPELRHAGASAVVCATAAQPIRPGSSQVTSRVGMVSSSAAWGGCASKAERNCGSSSSGPSPLATPPVR